MSTSIRDTVLVKVSRATADELIRTAPPISALTGASHELRLALDANLLDELAPMLREALDICRSWADRNEDAAAAASLIADVRDRLR